jgi:hypothetical protein
VELGRDGERAAPRACCLWIEIARTSLIATGAEPACTTRCSS